jgi:biopolymer transport protein ExbD
MAFGNLEPSTSGAPMAEINMIPLIDVMLVLLVIFIITAPLLAHSVKIDLPKASNAPVTPKKETVRIAIDAAGEVYWNAQRVDSSALRTRMSETGRAHPETELHIRADRNARYDSVAQVMSAAAHAGLTRIGFITDPTGAP